MFITVFTRAFYVCRRVVDAALLNNETEDGSCQDRGGGGRVLLCHPPILRSRADTLSEPSHELRM
jgi:hypothetical protein